MKKIYTTEFKTQAISLIREANRPAAEVARELGIKVNTIYTWLSLAQKETSKATNDNNIKEIKRLKKELAQTIMERDILKKAAAYFAKVTL